MTIRSNTSHGLHAPLRAVRAAANAPETEPCPTCGKPTPTQTLDGTPAKFCNVCGAPLVETDHDENDDAAARAIGSRFGASAAAAFRRERRRIGSRGSATVAFASVWTMPPMEQANLRERDPKAWEQMQARATLDAVDLVKAKGWADVDEAVRRHVIANAPEEYERALRAQLAKSDPPSAA